MNVISIEGTNKTPKVFFDHQIGALEIRGRSISENALAFYEPLLQWVEDYREQPADETQVRLHIEYSNSSSLKALMLLLKKLEPIQASGKTVKVYWYYEGEDEDAYNEGQTCANMLQLPFELVQVEGSGD